MEQLAHPHIPEVSHLEEERRKLRSALYNFSGFSKTDTLMSLELSAVLLYVPYIQILQYAFSCISSHVNIVFPQYCEGLVLGPTCGCQNPQIFKSTVENSM
jgi:hypothetical protein